MKNNYTYYPIFNILGVMPFWLCISSGNAWIPAFIPKGDVYNSSTPDNGTVDQWTDNSGNNQRWTLVKL